MSWPSSKGPLPINRRSGCTCRRCAHRRGGARQGQAAAGAAAWNQDQEPGRGCSGRWRLSLGRWGSGCRRGSTAGHRVRRRKSEAQRQKSYMKLQHKQLQRRCEAAAQKAGGSSPRVLARVLACCGRFLELLHPPVGPAHAPEASVY